MFESDSAKSVLHKSWAAPTFLEAARAKSCSNSPVAFGSLACAPSVPVNPSALGFERLSALALHIPRFGSSGGAVLRFLTLCISPPPFRTGHRQLPSWRKATSVSKLWPSTSIYPSQRSRKSSGYRFYVLFNQNLASVLFFCQSVFICFGPPAEFCCCPFSGGVPVFLLPIAELFKVSSDRFSALVLLTAFRTCDRLGLRNGAQESVSQVRSRPRFLSPLSSPTDSFQARHSQMAVSKGTKKWIPKRVLTPAPRCLADQEHG